MMISRRNAIKGTGLVVGTFLTTAVPTIFAKSESKEKGSSKAVVWKYEKLDPKVVADRAYALYPAGRCMYATAKAIGDCLADATRQTNPALSEVLTDFPWQMMLYGHSGMATMGSLCGTVNACGAIFSMFVQDKNTLDAMVQEFCKYYEQTPLPSYKPENAPKEFEPMKKSVAESILCHVSQGHWCKESGQSQFSSFRSERCRRLSADCAAKAVEMLNRYVASADTKFAPNYTDEKACVTCHGKGGIVGDTSAKMNCTKCHDMKEHY